MHQPGDELVRIYLISPQQRPYPPGSLRRAGGPPIGVDHHTRPRYLGTYMQHLLTIDLNDVPEIRTIGDLAGARALALFIADADTNEAFMIEPFTSGTSQTALVPLTDADLTHGEWTGEPVTDPVPRAFDLTPSTYRPAPSTTSTTTLLATVRPASPPVTSPICTTASCRPTASAA
jgi:hypothetical protein